MKKITVPYNLKEIKGCVFKLFYGDKYIVVMGKTLVRQVEMINNDIDRYFKNTQMGRSEGNIYFRFYYYIHSNPDLSFRFELVLQSENAYHLLKTCQIELDKGSKDDNCCNMIFEPYINKDIQRPIKNRKFIWWINRGSFLNFKRWQKRRVMP